MQRKCTMFESVTIISTTDKAARLLLPAVFQVALKVSTIWVPRQAIEGGAYIKQGEQADVYISDRWLQRAGIINTIRDALATPRRHAPAAETRFASSEGA